jgi:MFS family permease
LSVSAISELRLAYSPQISVQTPIVAARVRFRHGLVEPCPALSSFIGVGFGFGGEWAAGSVLIGEVIRAQHRGKAVGFVQSGWAPGWAAAALFSSLALVYLPKEIAWRVVFFIGITPKPYFASLARVVCTERRKANRGD